MKAKLAELYRNVEILKSYNEEKNREVEALISNSFESERRFHQYAPTVATHACTTGYIGGYSRVNEGILERRRI